MEKNESARASTDERGGDEDGGQPANGSRLAFCADDYVLAKYGQAVRKFERDVAAFPDAICGVCERLCVRKQSRRYASLDGLLRAMSAGDAAAHSQEAGDESPAAASSDGDDDADCYKGSRGSRGSAGDAAKLASYYERLGSA
jgi:hypothetical protein